MLRIHKVNGRTPMYGYTNYMFPSRHAPTFDSDDDSDSALVQNRIASRRPFSGEAHEVSRSHLGPHQPRSAFASRVPVEPTYPAPPPNYHPSYYAPPTQPPHQYPNHAYGMSQQGYPAPNPNPYGPSSHSSSPPYQESWSQYPPGYPPYGNSSQRQDSSGSRDYHSHALESRPAIENGSGDAFSRIPQTDLHVLLAHYKENHNQLRIREDLLRRQSAEQEQQLRAKDGELGELKDKIRNLEDRHSAEASRLHFQIGNLEEQVRELRELIAETKKAKRDAEESKLALNAAMRSWEDRYRELEDVHRTLERTSAEERERAWRDFDEWKSATITKHDAEKIALAIQFDKKLKQAGQDAENASELRSQLQQALEERDNLRKQRDEAETRAEEEAARANQLVRENDELMNQYNQLKAESQQEKEVIRSVANNLESEKSRLEKMMECYGDIAEIKSKGDSY
jgi:serine/arginine repetitive matrix protein 2